MRKGFLLLIEMAIIFHLWLVASTGLIALLSLAMQSDVATTVKIVLLVAACGFWFLVSRSTLKVATRLIRREPYHAGGGGLPSSQATGQDRQGAVGMARRHAPGRTVYPAAVWQAAGLHCPHTTDGLDATHQPYPDPWWQGESVFAPFAGHITQPDGPFYIFAMPEHPETFPGHLNDGDVIESPAARRHLPWGIDQAGFDGTCSRYPQYDVHAVYVTTNPEMFTADEYPDGAITAFVVEPDGPLWPDPEAAYRGTDRWCCRSARIIGHHRPGEATS